MDAALFFHQSIKDLFVVYKLVKQGFLERIDEPSDRRNVRITATDKANRLLKHIDGRLNRYIEHYFLGCTPAELQVIGEATRILCAKIEEENPDR